MKQFSQAAAMALFVFRTVQGNEDSTDTGCPTSELDCRAVDEVCGFDNARDFIALCGGGLLCQSATVVPAQDIKSKYMGTCKAECDPGHVKAKFGMCAPVCQIEDDVDTDKSKWLTVLDGEYVEADLCGNRCRCDASDGFQFQCSDELQNNGPCKPTKPVCEDRKNWKDSLDNGCTWYEADPLRCAAFGKSRKGPQGLVADQACCACGGGRIDSLTPDTKIMRQACKFEDSWLSEGYVVPIDLCASPCTCVEKTDGKGYEFECFKEPDCAAPEGCYNADLPSGAAGDDESREEWKDLYGRSCEWYEADPMRCLLYNNVPDLTIGYTAKEACCVCGGGLIDVEPEQIPLEEVVVKGDDSNQTTLIIVLCVVFSVLLFGTCGTALWMRNKYKSAQSELHEIQAAYTELKGNDR